MEIYSHIWIVTVLLLISSLSVRAQSVNCACKRLFKPVCGTDGRTYNNLCRLLCFSKRDHGLRVAYVGTCCPKPYCPPVFDPVCDNKGQSHENECMYRYAFCVMKKMDQVMLSIVSKGQCYAQNQCDMPCPDHFDPVCDLNAYTHNNLCQFKKANCLAKVEGRKELLLAYRGTCYDAANLVSTRNHRNNENGGVKINTIAAFERPNEAFTQRQVPKQPSNRIHLSRSDSLPLPLGSKLLKPMLPPSSVSYQGNQNIDHETLQAIDYNLSAEKNLIESNEQFPVVKGPPVNIRIELPEIDTEPVKPGESISQSIDTKGKHVSSCNPDECSNDYNPVCDSFGLSHVNECLFNYYACLLSEREGAHLTIAHDGVCEQDNESKEYLPLHEDYQEPEALAEDKIPNEYKFSQEDNEEPEPIVGDNGRNGDIYQQEVKNQEPELLGEDKEPKLLKEPAVSTLKLASASPLVEPPTESRPYDMTIERLCPNSCPTTVEEEFCDNNNRTYQNLCQFQQANCLSKIYDSIPFILVHFGACNSQSPMFSIEEESCPEYCTLEYYPICDSDNVTQGNLCAFQAASCVRRKTNGSPLEIAHFGDCNPSGTMSKEVKLTGFRVLPPSPPVFAQPAEGFIQPEFKTRRDIVQDSKSNDEPYIVSSSLDQAPQIVSAPSIETLLNSKDLTGSAIKSHVSQPEKTASIINKRRCPHSCPKVLEPVCATNNKTFLNLCEIERYNCVAEKHGGTTTKLKHKGTCAGGPPRVIPVNEEKPPMLQSLTQLICPKPVCKDIAEEPICDNQGRTHKNLCKFNHARCVAMKDGGQHLEIAYEGACVSDSCTIPSKCIHEDFSPVCASNFKTYPNRCRFQQESCLLRVQQNRESLEILYAGTCEECMRLSQCHDPQYLQSLENLTETQLTVCDHFQVTHDRCEFQVASCMYEKRFGKPLVIKHKGECCDPNPATCDVNELLPVCDSNSQTHDSMCHYKAEYCSMKMNDTKQVEELFIVHQGPCNLSSRHGSEVEEPKVSAVEPIEDDRKFLIDEIFGVLEEQNIVNATDSEFLNLNNNLTKINENETNIAKAMVAAAGYDMRLRSITADEPCPKSCPHLYQPVCGTDSMTYPNRCHLHVTRCAQGNGSWPLDLSYAGECCDRNCPKHWYPVCDSQGMTHANLCEFGKRRCMMERMENKEVTIQGYGICPASICTKINTCSNSFEPVCGSDGRTYINKCHIEQAICLAMSQSMSLILDYPGECCSQNECPYTYEPVCDSTARTHVNRCIFTVAKCRASRRNETIYIEYEGPCCSRPCADEWQPVCDGQKTHQNMCQFRVAQCEAQQSGLDLSVAYQGECCVADVCNETQSPQCDSDGDTHRNMCDLKFKRCITNRLQNRTVDFAYEGKCCIMQECSPEGKPVCDSQGITHASECHFQNAKCKFDRLFNSTLELQYHAPCCSNNCPDLWEPVCDQHGRLYRNKCHFDSRACEVDRQFRRMLLAAPCPTRVLRKFL